MKKIIAYILGLLAIVAGLFNGYLLFFKGEKEQSSAVVEHSATEMTSTMTTVDSSQTAVSQSTTNSQTDATGQFKDGTYTGAVTSTHRGDYQVQVTISGGKVSDITILEYPTDNPESQSINDRALPKYTAEALSAQSAEINQISGATEAFKGFTGSLQDALNQAQNS